MDLQFSTLENGIRLLKLTGRLDTLGAGEIEPRFNEHCDGDNALVIVDLSGVDFLASIGIRLLVGAAKSVAKRGGRLLIVGPNADVHMVLDLSGIPAIIPLHDDVASARAVLQAG